jgi:F-type H+-transporting ATPase subunit b
MRRIHSMLTTSRGLLRLIFLIAAIGIGPAAPALAQEHAPAKPEAGAAPAAAAHAEEEEHSEGILPTVARLFNFAILAGVLVYFLRAPIRDYLQTRSSQIRQDLVTAAEMRRTATAQLEQIKQQLASLPAELETLKTRGAEDIAAEEQRIAEAAKAERTRLLEQTRREIDMRLRIARRELTEHAAQLAVQVAEQRISRAITRDDQLRLLDRYSSQLSGKSTS